jgi:lipoprotein-anchoring transpeptidase ErfK/SrfK
MFEPRRSSRPIGLLVAAALIAGSAAACGNDDDPTAGSPSTTATTSTVPTTTTAAPTTAATTTTTAPPPTTTTSPAPALDVARVQRRLQELHYWVGPLDGDYATLTEQAVYAFQKVNGLTVDGSVGPDTLARLDAPVAPVPQSTQGVVWEVDKTKQVLMVVRDGRVEWIWNTSTGTEQPYTFNGRRLMADTPVGHYTFTREIDGWRFAPMGRLWRPKYFHPDGLAIHGYSSVPPYPASHGCVRVTNAAMDAIWSTGLAPVGASIWIYGESPV